MPPVSRAESEDDGQNFGPINRMKSWQWYQRAPKPPLTPQDSSTFIQRQCPGFWREPVGAGILTVHLRRPDSRNNLPFARSRAVHAERLDLVISDTVSAVELKPAIIFVEAGRIKTKGRALKQLPKR
jgi:hypothetical protein